MPTDGPDVAVGPGASGRVLHVVESLGGGVLTSILSMVDATPGLEHQLAIWRRREHAGAGDHHGDFARVHLLPGHPRRASRSLRGVVAEVRPDVVHAHSSYAGALVRVTGLSVRVAYSPHCFAFERRDLGTAGRAVFRELERLLARRTDVLVACSPHEADLALDLGHRRVVAVPNRALDPPGTRAAWAEPFTVVGVGRVAAQKDWRRFAAVKRQVDARGGAGLRWEWLGGGDPAGEDHLRANGIEVSGWLPRAEATARLAAAQAYLHTAAWEGAPVSVLEAAAAGLPLAARAIPALTGWGVPGVEPSVDGLADRLVDLRDPATWTAAQHGSLRFAAEHSASVQRYRLGAAYEHVPASYRTGTRGPGAGRDQIRRPADQSADDAALVR
ncbi:MAG TPA: glycosyltransferase [Nocardioides sp.]|nr:glycosyltransferase [Nocardioides sp.]